MQVEETATEPRPDDENGRWRSDLADCLAMYRAVTGDASQTQPLQPTDALAFGPYTVVGLIGQGGMGRVYSARATDGTRVAIKALVAHAAARDAALPRFQRELAAARRIEGRLTARVVDADLDADPPWLATEYIQGPTLNAVVSALGALPMATVSALAVGIASALVDIHAAGVVHRDLKPSNILLALDGLRVVDFGIARTADGITLTGPGWTLGTPAYMAPEQVIGEPAEAAADVFALGSVLVYAATGEPPFGVDEATTVMYRTVHDAPMLDGVAEPLRGVIESCLEKDPANRPTPSALIERMLELLGYVQPVRPEVAEEVAESGPAEETVVTPVVLAVVAAVVEKARLLRKQGGGGGSDDGEPTQDGVMSAVGERGGGGRFGGRIGSRFGFGWDFGWRKRVRGRGRLVAGAAVGVVLVVAGTVVALVAAHQPGGGKPTQAGQQASHGAVVSHVPVIGGGTPAAALPQRFVTGPGCAQSPWTDTTQTIPAAEQFVANVGGGDPECGGVAATFRKSGATAPTDSGFTWEFRLRRAARCTLSIYVANTNSSSGVALYQVTSAGTTAQFRLNQALFKGQWVQQPTLSGLNLTDGLVRLRLTDAGSYVGDRFHVTVSAVRADCS